MKIRFILISLFVFILIISCLNSYRNTENYKIIKNAESFSVSGTTISNKPTKEILAFRNIFLSINAKSQFFDLLSKSNYEGKLYALCGIYHYDYEYYKKIIKDYLKVNTDIIYFEGCAIIDINIKDLILRNKENVVRLKNNKQTIDQWLDENENLVKTDTKNDSRLPKSIATYTLDFIGGGYPQKIIENLHIKK